MVPPNIKITPKYKRGDIVQATNIRHELNIEDCTVQDYYYPPVDRGLGVYLLNEIGTENNFFIPEEQID